MDDFNLGNLNEARNEWCARLINIITPHVEIGFQSIFTSAYELCVQNEEDEKYLMTFQNLLSRVPKWNPELIADEVTRIVTDSSCNYLDDLITCVHIVQLKALTCIRVGQKHKRIDIDIPKLDQFIHKIYIFVARKLYKNIYLFETDISPLEKQKNNREFELIVRESILNAIRDSIPIENILRNYLDETTEEDLVETEEIISKPKESIKSNKNVPIQTEVPKSLNLVEEVKSTPLQIKKPNEDKIKLDIKELTPITANAIKEEYSNKPTITFNDKDSAISIDKKEEIIHAPKNVERLEQIAEKRAEQRKLEEMEEENNDDKIKIIGDLDNKVKTEPPPFLNDIIVL